MSEYSLTNYENRVFLESEEIFEYLIALKRHSVAPPNSDLIIAVGAQAQLQQWRRFEPVVRAAFKFRRHEMNRPLNPHLMPNVVDRAIWSLARIIDPDNWPQQYQTIKKYFELFDEFLPKYIEQMTDEEVSNFFGNNEYFDQFVSDCSYMNTLSNPVERAKGPYVLAAIYPEIFPAGTEIVEGGSSARNILTAMHTGFKLPESVIVESTSALGKIVFNDKLTQRFNAALEKDLELGNCVGIDEWEWRTGDRIRNVQRDHTITPAEEAAPPQSVVKLSSSTPVWMNAMQRYNYLDKIRPREVTFVRGDLRDPDLIEWPTDDSVPRKFGAILLPTVLHQQTPADRGAIMTTIRTLKNSPAAPETVQDYCIPNPANPHELLYVDDIYSGSYLYTTNVYDPEVGWQTIWVHESGRLAKSMVGDGGVRIDGKIVPVRERLSDFTS